MVAAEPRKGRFHYYRARYYDPKLGRFISEDPSRMWSGPNLYSYVENDPVDFTDPLGLMKVKNRVAMPTGALLINLRCLEECIGRTFETRVTETTGGHPPGNPHTLGVAADLTIVPRDPFVTTRVPTPTTITSREVLCCARSCSFQFSQEETSTTPGSTGPHFHVQIRPGGGGARSPSLSYCCP
jgi:RHS repeat-associated protein